MASFFFRKQFLLFTILLWSSGTVFGMHTAEAKTSDEAAKEAAAKLRLSSKSPFDPTTLKNGALIRFNAIHASLKNLKECGNERLNDVAAYGNLPLVMLLVDNFEVDASKIEDCSALCRTITNFDAKKQHHDICKFLLKQDHVDPKNFCERNGSSDDDKQHTIFDVVRYCDLETLKLFIARGVDVRFEDPKTGNTLLHAAAQFNKKDIAEWLLEKHNFDVDCENDKGVTPLYIGSEHGSVDVVKTLIDCKADVNKRIRGYDNSTALHIAGLAGHRRVVELLIGAGAKVTAQDNHRDTALCDALVLVNEYEYPNHGDPEVLELLCDDDCQFAGVLECIEHQEADPRVIVGWLRHLHKEVRALKSKPKKSESEAQEQPA